MPKCASRALPVACQCKARNGGCSCGHMANIAVELNPRALGMRQLGVPGSPQPCAFVLLHVVNQPLVLSGIRCFANRWTAPTQGRCSHLCSSVRQCVRLVSSRDEWLGELHCRPLWYGEDRICESAMVATTQRGQSRTVQKTDSRPPHTIMSLLGRRLSMVSTG